MNKTWTIPLLVCCMVFLLGSERTSAHGGITIDGDCTADWGSAVPATIHTSQVLAGPGGTEWVYLGEAGDARDDTGGTSSNNDIVEVRFTGDNTHLYFCVKMADITDWMIPNINIAVDTDHSGSDSGLNWAGDDTCSTCGEANSYAIMNSLNYIERQFNAHYDNSHEFTTPYAENFPYNFDTDPNYWSSTELNTAAANVVSDSIEGKIAWMYIDLGCAGPCSEISINLTSYRNVPGENGMSDTTFELTGGDGIDAMGGTAGISQNAWDREFSDGALSSFHTVHFGLPTAVDLKSADARVQLNPGGLLAILAIFVGAGLFIFRQTHKS